MIKKKFKRAVITSPKFYLFKLKKEKIDALTGFLGSRQKQMLRQLNAYDQKLVPKKKQTFIYQIFVCKMLNIKKTNSRLYKGLN